MPANIRRRYTEEFKREAVRLVRESATPWTRCLGTWGVPTTRPQRLIRLANFFLD